jgi:hypothetical protein
LLNAGQTLPPHKSLIKTNKAGSKRLIELLIKNKMTDKQKYLVWAICCWFHPSVFKTSIGSKLYPGDEIVQRKDREKLDIEILKEILSIAESIKKHPEWLKESK